MVRNWVPIKLLSRNRGSKPYYWEATDKRDWRTNFPFLKCSNGGGSRRSACVHKYSSRLLSLSCADACLSVIATPNFIVEYRYILAPVVCKWNYLKPISHKKAKTEAQQQQQFSGERENWGYFAYLSLLAVPFTSAEPPSCINSINWNLFSRQTKQ